MSGNDNRYHYRITEGTNIMYVCICKGIKESDVRKLGQAGMTKPKELACALGLNDRKNCCGRCYKNISKFAGLASEETSFPNPTLVI
jgi:bacterioferritin-associated ferredoxin